MRNIYLLIIILGLQFKVLAQLPANSLVGSWSFNDGTANDFSGAGNHGVVNGATLITDRFGNQNSAYIFDGVDDYISLTGCENFSSQKGTIAYWIKAEKYPNGIFNFYSTAPGEHHTEDYIRSYINLNGKLDLIVEDENMALLHVKYDMGQLANGWLNKWLHIAWTQDGNGVKLYINGEEKTLEHITASNSAWWSGHLQITNADIGQCWGYFDGGIDDFQIYNYALSATDIQGLYNAPDPNQASKGGSSVSVEITPGRGNYIIEKTYHTETTETSTNTGNKSVSINYFDGLGRASQRIQVAASPDGKDMIQHIAYDEFGRETKKYLPYTSTMAGGSYRDDAATEQDDFYKTTFNSPTKSVDPWSDIVYEESPLNRILEQGAPGSDFQAKGGQADHAVHFAYQTNDNNEVKRFELNTGDSLVVNAYYNASTLYKTGTRDENRVWSYEYKDILGQVIMKESDPGGLKLRTYYVYDIYGLLRYVIPPKAVELITQTTGTVDANIISNLCYYYEYDSRRRMVMKQLPGAGPVYLVYDKRDRLVLAQDGNQRTGNKWMFTKYDVLNRPVMTGIYDHGTNISQDSMQTIVNIQMVNLYEEIDGNYTGADFGYTNQSFPILGANDEILTVTYYDNYHFDQGNILDYMRTYNSNDFLISEISYAVKGLVTGTFTKVLGTTDDYLLSVNLYDDKYRVLRNYQENYLGGNDLFLNKIDYIGNVLKTKQVHVKQSGSVPMIINQRFTYDHALRLDSVFHEMDGNGEICMAVMEYNELGQLTRKKLNKNTDNSFLQEIDYEYNIRGWTTKINDPDNLGDDLFAMQLAYNEDIGLGATAQYNGNISAIKWANSEETVNRGYAFGYDNVDRLIKGDHFENSTTTTNFDLEFICYDANGNIDSLSRYGDAGRHIDDLVYVYGNSNQRQSVSDIAADYEEGFYDGANTTVEYGYDENGNLAFDDNKSIADIRYNYLNLPERINFGSGDSINFIYDATGVKLARLISGTETGDRYYIGIMEYNEAIELEYIHTDEGRVRISGTDLHYDYYLKDHLGNTRVSFTESTITPNIAEALQVDNYYPFGMRFNQAPILQVEENNYLYNGKELQKNYGLGWYFYGARYYSPADPTFTTIDPLAEMMPGITPYHFCYNNPISYTDPTGMMPERKASTFINPNGNIIEVRDDGDRNIYLVHNPDNWDGSKDGLATVGHTPEPATLKKFVGKNLYTEEVAGYMYDIAQIKNKEASIYVDVFQVGPLAQLMQDRDEMIKLLDEMKNLNKKQLALALKIMKNNELRLNEVYRNEAEDNVASMRILLRLTMFLSGQLSGINVDDQDYGVNYVIPESSYDKIDARFEAKSQEIIKKYDKMINNIKNK